MQPTEWQFERETMTKRYVVEVFYSNGTPSKDEYFDDYQDAITYHNFQAQNKNVAGVNLKREADTKVVYRARFE